MKNYIKPTLEIAKITTNEAIAAGSPVFNFKGVETQDGVAVTIYEIKSFEGGSQEEIPANA